MAGNRKVGGIVAELLLRDSDFRKKLSGAQKIVAKRAKQMRAGFNSVAQQMVKVGAIAGGIMAVGIGKAMQSIDKLAKTSDKLGAPVSRLQALSYAANLSGVATTTLEMAMQRMVRRVSEAAHNTGEAVAALKELKLSAVDLAKLSPDQQMAIIADAMNDVATSGDKVRLAMKLFDSEGVALVNTLAMGSEGFEEIHEKLKQYGIALTRMDLAQVEEANDAFTELKLIQSGLWDQLAIAVAGPLTDLAHGLINASEEMGGMGEVADKTFNFLLSAGGKVADSFWGWNFAIVALNENLLQLQLKLAQLQSAPKKIEFILKAKAVDAGIRMAAEDQLKMEGVIPDRGFLGDAWHKVKTVAAGGERSSDVDIEKAINARMESLRKELVPLERPDLSEENRIKDDLESIMGKLVEMYNKGSPSSRIEDFINDSQERARERAARLLEQNRARTTGGTIGLGVEGATHDINDLATASEAAAKELKKLSLSDIAEHGGNSSSARLARRAMEAEQKAVEAEARGRMEAAEKFRNQAAELESRLPQRQDPKSELENLIHLAAWDNTGKTAEGRAAMQELQRRGILPKNIEDARIEAERLAQESIGMGHTLDGVDPKGSTPEANAPAVEGGKGSMEQSLLSVTMEIRDLMKLLKQNLGLA